MKSILKIFDPVTKTWKGVTAIKGDTGKSAYQLAVEAGYAGTEQQFKTEQATVANNSGRLSAVESGKATLGSDGYVRPEQVNPLQGKQTGAKVGLGGHYYKPFPNNITQLMATSSSSFECFFEYDGSKPTTVNAQKLCMIGDNYGSEIASVRCYPNGYITFSMANRRQDGTRENITLSLAKLQTNNHIVLVIDRVNKIFTCYLNGTYFSSGSFTESVSNIEYSSIILGDPNANSKSFISRHSRIFNKALSQQEVTVLWNGGHPEAYRLIDKSILFAEYLPEYLSLTKWKDSSDNGNDLAAMGDVALSYGQRYSGSSMTPLFVARGAVFNETTGYYELNGLTDITENEMMKIYSLTSQTPVNDDWTNMFWTTACRTNYPPKSVHYTPNMSNAFGQSSMEVVNIVGYGNIVVSPTTMGGTFHLAINLRTILNVMDLSRATSLANGFSKTTKLENVSLMKLKAGITFEDSPNLTRDSILYMITNSANTTPITITLHTDALARLTREDIALASSKNITIA